MSTENQSQDDIFANIPKSKTPPKAKIKPTLIAALPKSSQKTAAPQHAQSSQGSPQANSPQRSRGEKSLRALWTITAVISMTVNVVVIALLIILFQTYSKSGTTFKLPPEIGVNTPKDLLQGLYDNFQLMDEAHIRTDIVVQDTIPVQFELPLKQETVVTLTEPVTISGARVTLSTGGLNIVNAPATVILPAGTKLPIMLNLTVPVDEMIDIILNVPVDINLAETDLNIPFKNLKEVVRPLYCLVAPDAIALSGEAVCP